MERCPLSGGGQSIESLHPFCRKHCEAKWEEALKSQVPDLDSYQELVPNECRHPLVVFSHEGLQSVDDTSKRFYSIVDACEDCERELLEETYTFECDSN